MMENGEGNIAFPVSYTKMKYAHYLAFFASHKDPKAFKAFIEDVRRIVDNAPENADLCGTLPQEPPLIGEEGVTIGCSSNTSRFSRFKVLASSKAIAHRYPMVVLQTDKHPYDSVICACILAFVHHFPAAEATSDGSLEDWQMGISLYEYSTERKAPMIHLREKK